MKDLYGIDMESAQYSKTFDSIPQPRKFKEVIAMKKEVIQVSISFNGI